MASDAASVRESSAVGELMALWQSDDPWHYDPAKLGPIQIAALRERFAERRAQLPVLDQRARDQHVDRIDSPADAVPLLFSHTTYKSYPASFVHNRRWDMMNRWLGTLSTHPTDNIDLAGVDGVDTWVGALHRAGHLVLTSSGTTGMTSYVNRSHADRELQKHLYKQAIRLAIGDVPEESFTYFWGGPDNGLNIGGATHRLARDIWGKPGDRHALSQEDISVAELDRLATIRKAVIEGTATPDMIADAERDGQERMARIEGEIQALFDKIFARRGEPILMFLAPNMLWRLVEAGRSRGIADGTFHPDTILFTGGGMKGFRGPANFREDALRFVGIGAQRLFINYGMTELNCQFQPCSEGRYHCPATTILMILDKGGETLLNPPSGEVEGRAGFMDLSVDGRWGGVISGDRVRADFDPCPCGRSSPSIRDVARYKHLDEGDEKLSCAGQIDTYVRGFTGGDWS